MHTFTYYLLACFFIQEKYQVPRALPILPSHTDPLVTCKDIDSPDELKPCKDPLIIDNTYESIAHLKLSNETDINLKSVTKQADPLRVELGHEVSISNEELCCNQRSEEVDDKSTTSGRSGTCSTGRNTSHKHKVSADVHQSSPASAKDGIRGLNLERDEQEYMIPEKCVENSYTPLHAKLVTNDSPAKGNPVVTTTESSKTQVHIEHEYLVPDSEEAVSPMSHARRDTDDLPNDPGYERAIKKTGQLARQGSFLETPEPTPNAEQVYESMFAAVLNRDEVQEEQIYEEAIDIDQGALSGEQQSNTDFRRSLPTPTDGNSENGTHIALSNDDDIYETPM